MRYTTVNKWIGDDITQDALLDKIISALSNTNDYEVRAIDGEIEVTSHERCAKVYIPIEQIIESFSAGNFEIVLQETLLMIEDSITPTEVDYTRVYPLIKSNKSIEGINVISEPLFTDVSLIYAQDIEHSYRYLSQKDKLDIEKVKCFANENINSILPILKQIDSEIPIFSIDYLSKENSDLASSLILNSAMQNQIRHRLGQQFLFSMPYANLLLISALDRTEMYVQIMKMITCEFINSPNKISDYVYLSRGGKISTFERMYLYE